jgi:hypothetical protein
MKPFRHHRPAVALLATVIIVGSVALLVTLTVASRARDEVSAGYALNRSEQAQALADACVEDTLLELTTNPGFAGATTTFPEGQCVVTVTSGTPLTVDVLATVDQARWKRHVVVNVTLSALIPHVKVTKWVIQE